MRVALGQINSVVGDLAGNAAKVCEFKEKAEQAGAELVVFPELAICGYPPEDLLYKKHFLDDNLTTVKDLAKSCTSISVVVGFAEREESACYNSAALIQNGKIAEIYRKGLLPTYGVFDEARYFEVGRKPLTVEIGHLRTTVTICRDIWDIDWLTKFLKAARPIQLLVNLSSSPFHLGKTAVREKIVAQTAKEFNCAVCYCNLVGGQDELVFDGRSLVVDSSGQIKAKAAAFEEELLIAELSLQGRSIEIRQHTPAARQPKSELEEVHRALVLGTRDYVKKNGFQKVLLGLSGGIDSSVVAAIAAEAVGPKNVIGVTMPSKFNTSQTISDAEELAFNLSIEFLTVPIEQMLEQFDKSLSDVPGWDNKGVAYENLQARIRGNILMSLSNQLGALVLTTGNKSETAVGYCTLYGDTAGGFAVIKDVPKTLVYKLAEHINQNKEVIPEAVIKRPPSAELKADQKDTDSLPDYELLDRILQGYVEQDKSVRQLIDSGLPKDTVLKVSRMVDRNEYKRRQSPPGIKITPKAFGKDRRLPITNHYSPT